MLIHLKDEDFKEEINSGVVLVDFYADWCGPCKMISPIIEELANERSDIKFIKVNVDKFDDLSREFGIMSIPTILIFKEGELVNKNVGFVSKEIIEGWLD